MPRLALLLAVLSVSTAAPLIHLAAPAPALTVAAVRIGVAAVLLHLIARGAAWTHVLRLPARERWLVVGAGGLLGAHFASWIASLYLTSTAASVALVATQPMFAIALGRLVGDRSSRRELMGGARADSDQGSAVMTSAAVVPPAPVGAPDAMAARSSTVASPSCHSASSMAVSKAPKLLRSRAVMG